ncbi:hypothetical protein [Nonomuraea aurantiaca]|jgi:hypothetical protein|uniref:hypothetical protein n=1 Tax=Nonomuraea aurantiaca TaxID=2878562 RepID=UPI001CDA3008|nr:hypothetical protein [Nonomuraea aurantiaca]MCA2219960.1 hypothetical protein [Nonomuraea aurantiaca]
MPATLTRRATAGEGENVLGASFRCPYGSRRVTTVPVPPTVPVVQALKRKAAAVTDAELGRLASRAPGLDAAARAEIRDAVQRVVDAFLCEPINRVTSYAGSPLGESYADALRELFSLELPAFGPAGSAG